MSPTPLTGPAASDRPGGTTGKRVVLVAAVAENGVIGRNGDLPWQMPEDLRRFRSITTGNTVVMGRRTFESIGRPLPERTNIIITRQRDWAADGVLVAHGVKDAITLARVLEGDIMIIGGAQIYEAAMAHADVQLLTEVHSSPDGDTFYPAFDEDEWVETEREAHEGFAFVRYDRGAHRA